MELFLEWIKALLLGILEGITEWLPISSTGHLLLLDRILNLNESEAFKEVFFVFIQLGAILAVVLLFWNKMFPFKKDRSAFLPERESLSLWFKVILACIPGAVLTLLFDDALDRFLNQTKIGSLPMMPVVIALALVFYGVLFILIERKKTAPHTNSTEEITCRQAFVIGLFQTLSIIPGTSRSGSTILGAMLLGINRPAAAEFTFFLAVPVMLGYSLLKLVKFGFAFSLSQSLLLLTGCITAFLTSLFVIQALMSYVKKHSFSAFGIYRIGLGILVLLSLLQ